MGANKTFISGATDRKQQVVRNAEGFILVLGEFGQAIYGWSLLTNRPVCEHFKV